ncbi:hypothetical protein [Enterobacter mori]|uniref:hypothetical protein n=1 Tax=Enterobacter mori TaxID=539813 RepID=UPI002B200CBC|nr:hypothetical protein [Enterobacter mori]MEA5206374.1 hypothetical protein [Enterobacter mori]
MPRSAPHSQSNASPPSDWIDIVIPEENLIRITESSRQRSWLRRQAGNAGAIAARNTAAVVIPTAVREFLRRYAFNRIAEGSPSLALGSVAGYFPCVLEAVGLYRDVNNHTYTR